MGYGGLRTGGTLMWERAEAVGSRGLGGGCLSTARLQQEHVCGGWLWRLGGGSGGTVAARDVGELGDTYTADGL